MFFVVFGGIRCLIGVRSRSTNPVGGTTTDSETSYFLRRKSYTDTYQGDEISAETFTNPCFTDEFSAAENVVLLWTRDESATEIML